MVATEGCGRLRRTGPRGYVRRSELKDQSPHAVDVSDLKAAEEVGSQVEAERRIIGMERKRLRTESHDNPS